MLHNIIAVSATLAVSSGFFIGLMILLHRNNLEQRTSLQRQANDAQEFANTLANLSRELIASHDKMQASMEALSDAQQKLIKLWRKKYRVMRNDFLELQELVESDLQDEEDLVPAYVASVAAKSGSSQTSAIASVAMELHDRLLEASEFLASRGGTILHEEVLVLQKMLEIPKPN